MKLRGIFRFNTHTRSQIEQLENYLARSKNHLADNYLSTDKTNRYVVREIFTSYRKISSFPAGFTKKTIEPAPRC